MKIKIELYFPHCHGTKIKKKAGIIRKSRIIFNGGSNGLYQKPDGIKIIIFFRRVFDSLPII
jgi:hypothetical protein